MTRFSTTLAALGNDGAVRNVQSDIDRRAAVLAHLETLAVRLALVDPLVPAVPPAVPSAVATSEAA